MAIRRFSRSLATLAVMAVVVSACGTDEIDPAAAPIKIGVLTTLSTGPFTPWGLQVRDGMKLAVDEINAGGGVDGRRLELVESDTQSDPEEASTGFDRLGEEGVVAIGGIISSAVGVPIGIKAEEQRIPLFLVKAGSDAILTQASRFTFRTCLPAAPMVAEPIAQYVEAEGVTIVGAIIADYAWGQAMLSALQNSVGTLPGVTLLTEVVPVDPTQDFTTPVRQIADAELIVSTGHPPGVPSILRTSADLGQAVPVIGAYHVLPAVMEGVGATGFDRYADFDCADYQSGDYQDLARRYVTAFGTFMEDDAVAGYGIVTMVAEAVREVGDDRAAIAEYLHANTFDLPGYAFEMGWTEWGELAKAQPIFSVIRQQEPPEGVNPGADWYPETLIKPDPLEPYVP